MCLHGTGLSQARRLCPGVLEPLICWNGSCLSFAKTGVCELLWITRRKKEKRMNNLLRGALAGAAAWKLGGGLISTIIIFLLVFWILGKC
jgi:hypothetical protein